MGIILVAFNFLDGTKVHRSASLNKLSILEIRKNLLWERR